MCDQDKARINISKPSQKSSNEKYATIHDLANNGAPPLHYRVMLLIIVNNSVLLVIVSAHSILLIVYFSYTLAFLVFNYMENPGIRFDKILKNDL